nr:CAZy families GH65 protein [uncultured Clostridium sp.]
MFKAFWESSDIEINGDDVLQKGIRVNLFHLFNSAGRDGKDELWSERSDR